MFSCISKRNPASNTLNNRGRAHSTGNTKRGQTHFLVLPLQLIQQNSNDNCPRRPQGMAHGNRAAIHVQLFVIDVKGLHETQDHAGKSLVHFEEVDVT